ncbi:MAG: hypothetical protein GY705_13515 [Bacteroidetes bacterium]|nr:hypothetical protein [Bacteroidota bacterium]
MKALINVLFFGFMLIGLIACSNHATSHHETSHDEHESHDAGHSEEEVVWTEMDAFHEFMSGTFHPAEEGNFGPLMLQAADMAEAAKKWTAGPIPEAYKDKDLKELLDKLATDTDDLAQLVTTKADTAQLKEAIFAAHDLFHEIVGKCEDDH